MIFKMVTNIKWNKYIKAFADTTNSLSLKGSKINSIFISFTLGFSLLSSLHIISAGGLFVNCMHINVNTKEFAVPVITEQTTTSIQAHHISEEKYFEIEKIKHRAEEEFAHQILVRWWMRAFFSPANEHGVGEATENLRISSTNFPHFTNAECGTSSGSSEIGKNKAPQDVRDFEKEQPSKKEPLDSKEPTEDEKRGVSKVWDEARFTEGGIVGILLTLLWRLIEWSNERRNNNSSSNNNNSNNNSNSSDNNNDEVRIRSRRHMAVDYALTPLIVMGICSILPGLYSK